MKNRKSVSILLGGLLILGACTGGGEPSPVPPAPEVSVIPEAVKALLASQCNTRPSPLSVGTVVNGVTLNYTEVLSEQDEGNILEGGTQLTVTNIKGNLYVEPSTDGKISWGARKWVLAESKEKADEAMKNVKISSLTSGEEAQVVTDHPSDQLPGARYEVCLVVKAPADWAHSLENGSGNITSVDHAGPLAADNGSGNVTITQKGSGNVLASIGSGNLAIETDSSGGVLSADTGSGNVAIIQRGPGFVTASSGSGNVTVDGDSRGGVALASGSGNVVYTARNGGVALENTSTVTTTSGNILLTLFDGFGFRLDAEVQSGNIFVPDFFPMPEALEGSGQRLVIDVNGGGNSLTLDASSGNVTVIAAD